MDVSFVGKLLREAILHTLLIASPVLIISLLIGLVVSIFQTTTSIQEQTLTFVPKLVGIFAAIVFFGSFMIQDLMNFSHRIFLMLSQMVR